MLLLLELGGLLQNSENMRRVLELVAVLLDVNSEKVSKLRIPHRTTISKAKIKADLLGMQWRRFCFGEGMRLAASWQVDASEQYHYD